jgi:predicted DNA-binding WGR domain protein
MNELRRFTRYGEKKAGVHNKFYEVEAIELEENGPAEWIFRWGRIGTAGQEKRGSTYSFGRAKQTCLEQFGKKEKRGYREVNAMEALASAVQDVTERKTNGLEPVEIEPPRFHAGKSEKRCQDFCAKWLEKLNIVRKSKHDLGYDAYQKQIEAVLKGYCREWTRIRSTKAHGHLDDNANAHTAFRLFFKSLEDNAGCYVSGYFAGVGVR